MPSARRPVHASNGSASNPSRALCSSSTHRSARAAGHLQDPAATCALTAERRQRWPARSTSPRSVPDGASIVSASATSESATPRHRARAFESDARSSPTPSPGATAGTDTSNDWPSRPRTNTRVTVWRSSPTRCDGWRDGGCIVRSSTRTPATRQHSPCTTASASPISTIGSTSTNGGSSDSTPWTVESVRPHLCIARRSATRSSSRAAEDDSLQLISQNFNIPADGSLTATIALPAELADVDLSTALIVVTVEQRVEKREDLGKIINRYAAARDDTVAISPICCVERGSRVSSRSRYRSRSPRSAPMRSAFLGRACIPSRSQSNATAGSCRRC